MGQKVAILGASSNPQRYANMAQKQLLQKGHSPVLVSPRYDEIDGLACSSDLSDIKEKINTLTMYVNASLSSNLEDKIIQLKPERVIFNPGTENPQLAESLEKHGIKTQEACTLVLLSLDQF